MTAESDPSLVPAETRFPFNAGAIFAEASRIVFRILPRAILPVAAAVGLGFFATYIVMEAFPLSHRWEFLGAAAHPAVAVGASAALTALPTRDAQRGKRSPFRARLAAALRGVLTGLPLGTAAGIALLVGAAAFFEEIDVLPALPVIGLALWIAAALAVAAPDAALEGSGFRAFARSARLTRGYRWQILAILAVATVLVLVGTSAAAVVAVLIDLYVSVRVDDISVFAMIALLSAPFYAFGGVLVALVHRRLLEIKEGRVAETDPSVFD